MTDPVFLDGRSSVTPALSPPALYNGIAIASGKGGVGKTWMSVNLAHALARLGQRVLVVDGDLGLANVDVQLGITPAYDLRDVLEGRVSVLEAITPCTTGGFDLLAGRSGSGSLATLPVARVITLCRDLHALSPHYDTIILDLAAGLDANVRYLADQAARVYVVVTDEPTSITDAYALMKMTWATRPEADIRLVVNMATNAHEAYATAQTLQRVCSTFLQRKLFVAASLERDAIVRHAIRTQRLLADAAPTSKTLDALARLAEDVQGVARPPIVRAG